LEHALSPQVVERQVDHDEDVLYFGGEAVLVATVRRGILQGLSLCTLEQANGSAPGEHFVLTRYARRAPDEIIVNHLPDPAAVEQALRRATGRRVRVTIPRRGAKLELLALCAQNYAYRTSL
ncbi:MAG: nucleotide excision repair endonuclease, partial [Anaerolineaceae bacterium]|nr:nucleotide excision repair endonuclease [Anaerolineaceae bacterium]